MSTELMSFDQSSIFKNLSYFRGLSWLKNLQPVVVQKKYKYEFPNFPVKKTTPKMIVKFGLTNLYNEQCNNHMHTTAHAILMLKFQISYQSI